MKFVMLTLAVISAATIEARAQSTLPDLKGTWSGKGKAIVLGSNPHHSSVPSTDTPRVRDIEATHIVEGQDGQLAWGRSSSAAADTKEPFVWSVAHDNKSVIGADPDGYFESPHFRRPNGKVLRSQWQRPDPLDRFRLLRNG